MKEYFARLNPMERRFVVVVGLLFFLVVNLVWVRPHFSDWGATKGRLEQARSTLKLFGDGIKQIPALQEQVQSLESEGASVPAEEQSVEFLRTIQTQAGQSNVRITQYGHQTTRTNQFFIDQLLTITVEAGEKQLVDFLYQLGSGNSLIRVQNFLLNPNQPRQLLEARIGLLASYQRAAPVARPATLSIKPSAAPKTPAPATKTPAPPAKPPAARPPPPQKTNAAPAKILKK
jgi:Tfp pilus assembly protein PilO